MLQIYIPSSKSGLQPPRTFLSDAPRHMLLLMPVVQRHTMSFNMGESPRKPGSMLGGCTTMLQLTEYKTML
jgi:hypothetical protein